jgi:hypothetical protein
MRVRERKLFILGKRTADFDETADDTDGRG